MLSAYSATNHLPIHLSAIVEPLSQEVTGNVGKALWLLFAAVLGLLLIACVNLASLQLARAIVRERDNAVRAALGAGRMRLFQAALMESVVLLRNLRCSRVCCRMRDSAQFELPRFEGSTPCCCEQLNKGFYVLTDPVEDLGKAEFVPVH
jgi:hypothetical protein